MNGETFNMVLHSKHISVSANSCPGLNMGCYTHGKGGIEIEDKLRIGPNTGHISANHSIEEYGLREVTKPIHIGNNAWIHALFLVSG